MPITAADNTSRTNHNRINSGQDPGSARPATPPAHAAVDTDRVNYCVKKGESLTDVAKRHDSSVEELLELNPALRANPNALRAGQTLEVPAADKADAPARRAPVAADTQAEARQRAAGADNAARNRVLGPYSTPAPALDDIRSQGDTMRRGMSGDSVRDLQRKLNAAGAQPPLADDGKFGPKTEAALREYQADRGIQQTGVLGPTTLKSIDENRPVSAANQERVRTRETDRGRTRETERASNEDLRAGANGQRIGDAAEREARRLNSVGRCALGVNNALTSLGITGRGHAFQKAEQLARNPNFREANISRDQLDNLPRGAVVVWGRSGAKPYGHVSVALGDGREASDHIQRQTMGGRYGTDFGRGPDPQGRQFRVFLPVDR